MKRGWLIASAVMLFVALTGSAALHFGAALARGEEVGSFVLWYETDSPGVFVPSDTKMNNIEVCLYARDILARQKIKAYCIPEREGPQTPSKTKIRLL